MRQLLVAVGGMLSLVGIGIALVAPFYLTRLPGDGMWLARFLNVAICVSAVGILWYIVDIIRPRVAAVLDGAGDSRPQTVTKADESPEAVAAWKRHVAERLRARPNLQVTSDGRAIMGPYEPDATAAEPGASSARDH